MTARAPEILIADDWQDYRVLDSGNGGKLEQVGPYRFVRPEPQALWAPALSAAEWDSADAIFSPSSADDDEAGRWRFNRELPQNWTLRSKSTSAAGWMRPTNRRSTRSPSPISSRASMKGSA